VVWQEIASVEVVFNLCEHSTFKDLGEKREIGYWSVGQ